MPHIPSYYQDYYQVLEVNQDATEDMIKKSYRKLAKQHHPDKTYHSLQPAEKKIFDIIKAKRDKNKSLSKLEEKQSDQLREKLNKKFQQISIAYKTLSDPKKRAEYDRKRLGNTNHSRNSFNQPTADCKINDFRASIILGNLKRCRSLIEDHNIDVNLKFGDSKTPVEVAIEIDQLEILGLLISKGANISPSNNLSYAVKYSANKVFSFLLEECRIRINSKNENGETALHRILKYCSPDGLSALYKYKSFIEQLLDAGTKLDVKNKDNLTPFDILIDYVENELSEFNRTQKLNFVSGLLSKYKIEKLEKLKYKDGTLAVNKLMKLAVKCNSKEVIVPIGELFINLIDRKDSHILQLEKDNDNLNNIIRELDKTRVELAEKKRRIEQKLTRDNLSFTDKLHQLQNNLNELDVQVAQLTREKSRLQDTLENKQTILDEKDSQIKSLNEKLESKNRELNDIQQQILALKSKNEGKIKALHEQLENKSELENRIKTLQKQLANKGELKSQITELQKQIQGVKGKVNYIPIVFILSIASAVGASLTIPYLTVCITLTAVALAFLVVGCCYSYKAKTALENVEVNQQQNCQTVA